MADHGGDPADRARQPVDVSALLEAPVSIVVSVEGELVDANQDAADLLQTDRDALLAGFADSLYGDDERAWQTHLARVGAAPTRVTIRWGAAPPVRYLSARSRTVATNEGDVVVSVLLDTTEEHRLDTILGMATNGAQVFDIDTMLPVWSAAAMSRAFPAQYEASADDVDGPAAAGGDAQVELAPSFHPDDLPRLFRILPEMVANPGTEFMGTVRVAPADLPDAYFPTRYNGVYLPDHPAIGGLLLRWEVLLDPVAGDAPAADGVMSLAQTVPVGVIGASVRGKVVFRNNLARAFLGAAADGPDALRWIDMARPEHQEALHSLVRDASELGSRESAIAAFSHTRRGEVWLRVEIIGRRDRTGAAAGWVATLLDVTVETEARRELQDAQERLWHLANHDGLTGLPNRALLVDRIGQALARRARNPNGLGLLYGDLDGFKQVNDVHGHEVGDQVLLAAAQRLLKETRASDTVCRFGGDEFVILCEDVDESALEALARRAIAVVGEPVPFAGGTARVGLSVGAVVLGAATDVSIEPDELLRRADAAMYEAKARGNEVVVRVVS